MSQCPKCGTSVDHDFGVVACSGCAVILFVDLDGNLQVSGDTPAEAPAEDAAFENPPESQYQAFEPAPAEEADSGFAAPGFETPPEVEAPAQDFGNAPGYNYATEEAPAEAEVPAEAEPVAEQPVNEEFALNAFDAPAETEASPADQLREVADFGNSSTEEGHALQYTIRIEGIDSKETRDRMFEILTDVRLGLNVRELQTQVVRGTLEIPQLNPVRASVIVGRLRELPLKLNWRQDAWKAT